MTQLESTARERLKQHRDNLYLWKSGGLDATVEDDEEKHLVMLKLGIAISELEIILRLTDEEPREDLKCPEFIMLSEGWK